MKRLTCLFIVGALMLVLSGVALAALPRRHWIST